MEELSGLMRWMAEVVHTGHWHTDLYDALVDMGTLSHFLKEVGKAIVQMFG